MANRGKFARLYIETDVYKPLVSKVMVGGKIQKVEYEGIGKICFHYGCIGHMEDQCEKAVKESRKEIHEDDKGLEEIQEKEARIYNDSKEGNLVPWTLAPSKKRGSKIVKKLISSKSMERTSSNNFQVLEKVYEDGNKFMELELVDVQDMKAISSHWIRKVLKIEALKNLGLC